MLAAIPAVALVALAFSACAAGAGTAAVAAGGAPAASVDEALLRQLYHNVEQLDVHASREALRKLRVSEYEFEHDSIRGRRQVGVLPRDAMEVLPEAVEIAPSRVFPPRQPGGDVVRLENFATVDKNVIFMHNVAALQSMATELQEMAESLEHVMAHRDRMDELYAELHRRLEIEADAQAVEKRKLAETEAEKARLEAAHARAKEEEAERILKAREAADLERLRREDAMARERAVMSDAAERNRTLEALAMQRETAATAAQQAAARDQQLAERRAALERSLEEQRREADVSRAEAEARAKALLLRETRDVRARKAAAAAEEERRRLVAAVRAVMENVTQGLLGLLDDPRKLLFAISCIMCIAAAIVLSREAAATFRRAVEARLGRPRLLRETSVGGGPFGRALRAVGLAALARSVGAGGAAAAVATHFADVVLPERLRQRVVLAASIAKGARRVRAPLRNLLLYGPPGTGKTMVARRLAAASGLDYAVMSGGDVAAVGGDSVRQLHALFGWAKRSPSGLLLFIDEAEAFLASRARSMSEHTRSALNALLYHTGAASTHFCLVLATNRAEDLDSAVLDRMDDALHFDLPSAAGRALLLEQYLGSVFEPWRGAGRGAAAAGAARRRLPVDPSLSEADVSAAAERAEGFSGREIAKLASSVHATVLCGAEPALSAARLASVVEDKVDEHRQKERMRDGLSAGAAG